MHIIYYNIVSGEQKTMLINFRFKNFKSFYGENQLSLQSVKDDELQEINTFFVDESLFNKDEPNELLKSAIIFGAIGRKKAAKGMGTAGMVIGIIVTALIVILFIFTMIFAASIVGTAIKSIN